MPVNFRLRELRTKAKYSQAYVGEQVGVAQQTIGKWEAGTTTPDPETIVKIASVFNVTTDYLLGCTDIPNIYLDTKKGPSPEERERVEQVAKAALDGEMPSQLIDEDVAALSQLVRQIVDQALDERDRRIDGQS